MDAESITIASAAVTAFGTLAVAYLGFKARQAEQRMATQAKLTLQATATQTKLDAQAAASYGSVQLNERQEAANIRAEQREEIQSLRTRLDLKDKQIDDLQDRNRQLQSTIERLEAQVEALKNERLQSRQFDDIRTANRTD